MASLAPDQYNYRGLNLPLPVTCQMRRREHNLEYCSVVECSVGETGTMVVRESPAITVEKMWMAQLYISHRQTTVLPLHQHGGDGGDGTTITHDNGPR